MGQDRFKRRYWILPHAGGVYVEGLESAEKEILIDVKKEEQGSVADIKNESNSGNYAVKFEDVEMKDVLTNGEDHSKSVSKSKEEKTLKSPIRSPPFRSPPLKSPQRNLSVHNVPIKVCGTEAGSVIHSNLNSNMTSNSEVHGSSKGSISKDTNCFMKSPIKLNNMAAEIDSYAGANSSEAAPANVFVKQKGSGQVKCWFNVIPRMPCDESSLTLSHTPHSGRFVPTYSKKDQSLDFINAQAITRPPGRPPKTSTPTLNQELITALGSGSPLTALQGQSLIVGRTNKTVLCTSPEKTVAMATSAYSTADLTTNSLSFEELKKQVLESLRQEPAPVPMGKLLQVGYIEDITWVHGDKDFIFKC